MASMAPAPAAQADAPPTAIKFTATCRHCQRVVTRKSRRAMTWRCPHCKATNPGPGLIDELAKPPEPGSLRRRRRRAAAADQRAERPAEFLSPSAAAPVRRKRSAPAARAGTTAPATGPTQGSEDAPRGSTPRVPASPPRGGFLDRLLYGEGDE